MRAESVPEDTEKLDVEIDIGRDNVMVWFLPFLNVRKSLRAWTNALMVTSALIMGSLAVATKSWTFSHPLHVKSTTRVIPPETTAQTTRKTVRPFVCATRRRTEKELHHRKRLTVIVALLLLFPHQLNDFHVEFNFTLVLLLRHFDAFAEVVRNSFGLRFCQHHLIAKY